MEKQEQKIRTVEDMRETRTQQRTDGETRTEHTQRRWEKQEHRKEQIETQGKNIEEMEKPNVTLRRCKNKTEHREDGEIRNKAQR